MTQLTFGQTYAKNFAGMKFKRPDRRVKQRFTQQDFEALKKEYIKEYGYTVTVPGWSDIIKWKPNFLKTKEELKEEKKQALARILSSPSPDIYKSYSTIMTWIDNIQDTSSILFPLIRMAARAMPKLMSRFIPVAGWVLLGFDILQLINTLGRAPFTPMRAKRAICDTFRENPFSRKAQFKRIERIKNWNPRISDLLQVLQTTADHIGVGLSLGALVGFIPDLISGLYRKATGEQVRFFTTPPPFNPHELNSAAAMKAAAYINTQGQTFSDDIHFLSLLTWSASTISYNPVIETYDFLSITDEANQAVITPDEPKDPLTIEVIKKEGLNIEEGTRFPFNDGKPLSLQELSNYIIETARENFRDLSIRQKFNNLGLLTATSLHESTLDLIESLEPSSELIEDEDELFHVSLQMIKAPIIPDPLPTQQKWAEFERWVRDWTLQYGSTPKIEDIKTKFDLLGITYKTSFPNSIDHSIQHLFPEGFDDSYYS